MPKTNSKITNNRRQFLKATVSASAAGLPLSVLGQNAGALPPIISLLLDDNPAVAPIIATAAIEGEGSGAFVNFPENTLPLNQGANTVETFFSKFRPDDADIFDGRDVGFDNLSAQLPNDVSQAVTLNIRATSPSVPTISVDVPNQTVMSDLNGLASFTEVLFQDQNGFNPFSGFENHIFELRFSSEGFEDYVITASLDLETPFLEPSGLSVEGASVPGETRTSFFLSGSSNTLVDFYGKLRPDLQDANGGPEIGIRSLSVLLRPRPATAIDVTVTAEVIEGNQISLDPITATQTVNTSSSFLSFAKIALIPNNFGPAGSAIPITSNHTIRFTWTAIGYTTAVYDIVLDLESSIGD